MIPLGEDTDSRRERQKLIIEFYKWWKAKHPLQKLHNIDLGEDINIKHISLVETSGHASLKYQSTLAVLQLDAILTYATKVKTVKMNPKKANQNPFKEIIIMHYICPGLGKVKLTVGVKPDKAKTKVQYCITVIDVIQEKRTDIKPVR